ncbi:MAG: ferredoxin [Rhodobacteraceae bacterium]|nr:ferredoxin [Paracoccaceae bacterium]
MAAAQALAVFGAFHAAPGDDLPEDAGTVLLFGPDEPGFWAHVTSAPEWADGAPDPLDRWSDRVIGAMARALGGAAHFPFGDPPHRPFYAWALRSGRAFASPVTLLVHDRAGLMVSYRGAIALPGRLPLPAAPSASPCDSCAGQPCRAACPAGALTPSGYDVPACHSFLDRQAGENCLSAGCLVRRACPISRAYGRLPEQSSYHMGLFHR